MLPSTPLDLQCNVVSIPTGYAASGSLQASRDELDGTRGVIGGVVCRDAEGQGGEGTPHKPMNG